MKRNRFHTYVAFKFGHTRKIVLESADENEINDLEIALIKKYHTFHYDPEADKEIASNFTVGGLVNRGFTYKLNAEQLLRRKMMLKEIGQRPEVIEQHRKSALLTWADPVVRAKREKNLKSPATIAARIAALKTPEVRAKICESVNRPEVKAKIKESKRRWAFRSKSYQWFMKRPRPRHFKSSTPK